ncbi:hypothetical protein KO528_06445 [Saccharophagus degradans]|uniref:hypothetical protein n=1 Tax=Saccharophagus degradans TaxID=86304 RepID=UPI001C0996CD|nr:hypothetical protein [Saccharophagus degradans]MBU2984980.1 hypothetical protein [Saccharophagus degradans]
MKKHYKYLLFSLSTMLLCLTSYYIGKNNAPKPNSAIASASPLPTIDKDIDCDIGTIAQAPTSASRAKNNNSAIDAPDTPPQNPTEQVTSQEIQTAITSQQAISTFTNFIDETAKSGISPIDAANERFESEPVDYDWAKPREDELYATFERVESLQSTSPLSVSCKTNNCKVVLPITNSEEAENITSNFTQALVDEGLETSVTYFIDESSGEAVFYLADEMELKLFK